MFGRKRLRDLPQYASSLVLSSELFYFRLAYYRGLIGRTLVFDRGLSPSEVADSAKRSTDAGQ